MILLYFFQYHEVSGASEIQIYNQDYRRSEDIGTEKKSLLNQLKGIKRTFVILGDVGHLRIKAYNTKRREK